jgi:cytochrome c1
MTAAPRKWKLLLMSLLVSGCGASYDKGAVLAGGDPQRGRIEIIRASCGSCHRIPGIPLANGDVGPPLERFSKRIFIAGRLYNTPGNLVRWLRDPGAVKPGVDMPDSHLSDSQARDVAAYLYDLR